MAEIVGILAGFVAPVLDLGKRFKKQFNYLCCLKTNIKDLTDAAKHLEDKRVDLQDKVEAAKRNGELILREVETWLADAEETQRTAKQIMEAQIPARILSLKPRYSLSRKAMKKTQSMKELRANCTFDHVSNPAPPASMGQTTPLGPTRGIGSRMKTEEDIILAMRDQDVYIIGVCGMGGVGKTTMAQRVMDRAREKEGLFDEVVMVAVGQQADMLKIQRDIADWLGIKLEEETLAPRAHRLRARLEGGKRKLIVIDDAWERINLKDLGIPCESGSCTILLTARNMKVFDVTDNKKVFTIETLSDEESWFMFQENVGACMDDLNLLPIAKEVAKECKGLPLALVVVSRALKDEKNMRVWSDALKQLRCSNPVDIENVIKKVYNPIKLSYDFLGSSHAKSLLFLCSSFPEDHDINLEYLMFYSFGLCMFDEISNLEEARNRIATLISTLKSRSLILDGRNEDYVKMHDVVRDVVIFIAAEEKHAIVEISSSNEWSREIPYIDCTMLSVVVGKGKSIELLPMELGATFPNLRFLWMHYQHYKDHVHSMSVGVLKGMQQLKVFARSADYLYLEGDDSNTFDLALGCYTQNKKHLELRDCPTVEKLGVFPVLETLRLTWLPNLVEIWDGSNNSFAKLKEIVILGCGKLRSLFTSSLDVITSLSQQLERLDISYCESMEEVFSIELLQDVVSPITITFPKLEGLRLRDLPSLTTLCKGNIIHDDIINMIIEFPRLLELEIGNCPKLMASFINIDSDLNCASSSSSAHIQDSIPRHALLCNEKVKFGSLKKLRIEGYENMSYVWCHHIPHPFFGGLEVLVITDCANINNLFSYSIAANLVNLKRLTIEECNEMVYVIADDKAETTGPLTTIFHELVYVSLSSLPKLQRFCDGNWELLFPSLSKVEIEKCPDMKGFSLGSISTPNLKEFKVDGQEKSVEELRPWQQVSSLNCSESEPEMC